MKNTWRFNSELSPSDRAPNDFLGYTSSISSGTILAGAPQATIGSNQFQGAKALTDFKADKIFDFAWSRDGRKLAVSRGRTTRDVVLLTDTGK